jgi:zinc/manganese transport system permease protein
MWAGLWLTYAAPSLPPSFAIVGVATVLYLAVLLVTAGRRMRIA